MGDYVDRVIVAGVNTITNAPVVMTSPDAITWTAVSSWPGSAASQVSVAGDTFFVATAGGGASPNYAYSTDGDNWTLETSPPVMACVAWTGTRFVNVATNVSYRATSAAGSWSGPTNTGSLSGQVGRRLIARPGILVGALQNGTPNNTQPPIIYSTDDGASWSTVSGAYTYDLDYGAGRYVAAVQRASPNLDQWIRTSTDGVSWSMVSTGINNPIPYTVRYGNGMFVAVGTNGLGPPATRTMTSTDGLSWTVHTPTGLPTSGLFATAQLAFWKGRFIFVNPTSGTIYSSTDGVAWSGTTFTNRDWRGVAAGVARPAGRRGLGLIRG